MSLSFILTIKMAFMIHDFPGIDTEAIQQISSVCRAVPESSWPLGPAQIASHGGHLKFNLAEEKSATQGPCDPAITQGLINIIVLFLFILHVLASYLILF